MLTDDNAGLPESKLSKLRRCYAAGDDVGALRIAAKFQDLGPARDAILSAWGAIQNPRTYLQMRKDPEALIARGVAAIVQRYSLPDRGSHAR
jgi:hypothetical protein